MSELKSAISQINNHYNCECYSKNVHKTFSLITLSSKFMNLPTDLFNKSLIDWLSDSWMIENRVNYAWLLWKHFFHFHGRRFLLPHPPHYYYAKNLHYATHITCTIIYTYVYMYNALTMSGNIDLKLQQRMETYNKGPKLRWRLTY